MFIFLFINQSGVVLALSDNLSLIWPWVGDIYIFLFFYFYFLLVCVFGRELVFFLLIIILRTYNINII